MRKEYLTSWFRMATDRPIPNSRGIPAMPVE